MLDLGPACVYEHWRLPPDKPATFNFSPPLTWMGIKWLTFAALLDFPNLIGLLWHSNNYLIFLKLLSQLTPMRKGLFRSLCIMWHAITQFLPLQQMSFKAWRTSWGLAKRCLGAWQNTVDILQDRMKWRKAYAHWLSGLFKPAVW